MLAKPRAVLALRVVSWSPLVLFLLKATKNEKIRSEISSPSLSFFLASTFYCATRTGLSTQHDLLPTTTTLPHLMTSLKGVTIAMAGGPMVYDEEEDFTRYIGQVRAGEAEKNSFLFMVCIGCRVVSGLLGTRLRCAPSERFRPSAPSRRTSSGTSSRAGALEPKAGAARPPATSRPTVVLKKNYDEAEEGRGVYLPAVFSSFIPHLQ
jgi:hypothetical protein